MVAHKTWHNLPDLPLLSAAPPLMIRATMIAPVCSSFLMVAPFQKKKRHFWADECTGLSKRGCGNKDIHLENVKRTAMRQAEQTPCQIFYKNTHDGQKTRVLHKSS
jgi:hypothetical protein